MLGGRSPSHTGSAGMGGFPLLEADVAINEAQEMILRNLIFYSEIVEQRLRARVMSHHEQQASERGNEQQLHELWPAYNLTAVLEQASSQVLFQQQLPLSQVIRRTSGRARISRVNACGC